jgi:hypothetical protein
VERVLWLTLREQRSSYARMNDVLRVAASRHAELTVVEWDRVARSHPEWFNDDGLHLDYDGALGLARLIHQALLDAGAAQPPFVVAAGAWDVPSPRSSSRAAVRPPFAGPAGQGCSRQACGSSLAAGSSAAPRAQAATSHACRPSTPPGDGRPGA